MRCTAHRPGGGGRDGFVPLEMEENGSRVSDETMGEDEVECLAEANLQGTAYAPSPSTKARWYSRARDLSMARRRGDGTHLTSPPKRVDRQAMGHRAFDAPSRGAQVAFVTLVLGLMLALAVQTARLWSATAKHADTSQFADISELSGPIQDMYQASMVVRPPPAPFDKSSIVVEEPSHSHEPVWRLSDDASRLPKCGQFILMPFFVSGWGSNVGLLLRAAMYAQKLGIVLLVDNNNWPYGRLEYYFEPYTIDCVPPSDWYDESQTTRLRAKGWRKAARIRVSRKDTRHMDAMDQELFFDREKDGLQHVQRLMLGRNPKPSVLPASETLPAPLIPAFREYAQLLHTMFKPVPEILEDVERVKTLMGIGGKRPTIAVQVRLGDKVREYKSSTRFIKNTFGNLTAHLEVMHALYDRLIGCLSVQIETCYPLSPTARRFSIDNTRPRAILLTIEDDALGNIARNPIAPPFEFDRTPGINVSPNSSFLQSSFDELPLKARVASARALVRDIIIAARETDATVLTMGSNLGRLISLFAGPEAVLGPKNSTSGDFVGGRMSVDRRLFAARLYSSYFVPFHSRALDIPWFASTNPHGVWSRLPPK
ncbi:BZ3500_MvSof-1268-A1-R1_Chr7-1g09445 [Microbotryum saponariae]|uniref:BZ3500_MvSof-1268-A1-R1_Chr7-1g09445 protein n=1 Tax=Microbotryum saponariae TaxID=289078 RepID=A0A2X0N837_9BASI|nr:BZ3501_MvSof-1269-A2-R1_Chr7-1g09150 [Microbotryum saponariae]SDA03462.1 BZ3500_MvSof-1268-A1-R1_Chr7-1g09445 [Microbotryum saponariae]